VIAFGDRVREARQRIRTQAGGRLTQSDLAVAVGVERNTVSRWENSGVCPKDPQVIRKLAAVLRVSMDWLLSDEGAGTAGAGPGGVGGETAGQTWFGGTEADRVVRIPGGPSEVVAYRIPPIAYERLHGYIERVEQAGATVAQAEEVARLLVDAAANRLRARAPRERAIAVVIADIDAAWRFASSVLRSEGLTLDAAWPTAADAVGSE
jgi:transcriptional regulator with XRE-family HTH domain